MLLSRGEHLLIRSRVELSTLLLLLLLLHDTATTALTTSTTRSARRNERGEAIRASQRAPTRRIPLRSTPDKAAATHLAEATICSITTSCVSTVSIEFRRSYSLVWNAGQSTERTPHSTRDDDTAETPAHLNTERKREPAFESIALSPITVLTSSPTELPKLEQQLSKLPVLSETRSVDRLARSFARSLGCHHHQQRADPDALWERTEGFPRALLTTISTRLGCLETARISFPVIL